MKRGFFGIPIIPQFKGKQTELVEAGQAGAQPKGKQKGQKREKGIVSAVAALGMVAMTLATGFAVDVSHLYLAGTELQNAADASALAAASMLNGGANGITAAVDKAISIQNRYEFGDEVATLARSNVRFGVNLNDLQDGYGYDELVARIIASQIRFVRVTVPPKPVNTPFASLALGQTNVDLSRKAIAGFSAGLHQLCNAVIPLSLVQDDETHAPLEIVGSCSNTWAWTPGCKYIIRDGSNGNGNGWQSPGNFQILDFTGSGGGSAEVRVALAGNPFGCFKPGDIVSTKTGISAEPVRDGLNSRFGDYGGGLSAADYPPDTNVKEDITYAQYRSGWSWYQQPPPAHLNTPGRDGRRVIIVPIVNESEWDQGNDTVKIHKFAAMFLQRKVPNGNGGDIYAEFITTNVNVQEGTYIAGNGQTTQFSVPVLYY
jgi:hypothetical protein